MFLPHPRVKVSIARSLRDREVACSASDRQGSNFESCVWRTVSSQSSHHPQEVLLAQFSLHVHKGGLKADSFHFCLKCLAFFHKLIQPSLKSYLMNFVYFSQILPMCVGNYCHIFRHKQPFSRRRHKSIQLSLKS